MHRRGLRHISVRQPWGSTAALSSQRSPMVADTTGSGLIEGRPSSGLLVVPLALQSGHRSPSAPVDHPASPSLRTSTFKAASSSGFDVIVVIVVVAEHRSQRIVEVRVHGPCGALCSPPTHSALPVGCGKASMRSTVATLSIVWPSEWVGGWLVRPR
jgi:hypothetical protein